MGGGAEKVFVDLANEYVRNGHVVTMICAKAEGPFLKALDSKITIVDLGVSRVLLSVLPLAKFLKSHKTDVIVSAMLHANIGLIMAARILQKIPTRIIVQDVAPLSGTIGNRMGSLRFFMKHLYPMADGCLAISNQIAAEINKAVGWHNKTSKVHVLPNPVVLSHVHSQQRQDVDHPWLQHKTVPVILAVGRLSIEKDFPTLLQAFALARQQKPMKLIVIGEGEERQNLETIIQKLGLEDDVSLPGFVQNPYVFMAHADVVVVSSLFEGFSLVILEALATGTSLVITDCGDGPMSMVEYGNFADVVPVGGADDMAKAIIMRIENPFEALRQQRQAKVYDIKTLAPLYLDVLIGTQIQKSQNRKHICFYVPSLAGGGAERLVVDLANFHALKNGFSTIICGEATGPYLSNVGPGVEIIELGHARVLLSLFALRTIIRKLTPDVIFANMSHANVVLIMAAKIAGNYKGRIIVQEVAQIFAGRSDQNPIRDRLVLSFMKRLYPFADKVIAISTSIGQELKELANSNALKIQVLPGSIDFKMINRRKNEDIVQDWFDDDNIKVIIAIGRFSVEKDFRTLIAAFAQVHENQNVRLIILGEGLLRADLRAQCKALGLQNDVSLPGFVENPFAYLKQSDVFVLSSIAEGFGLVVAEALACGCNVVVTKCSQGPIDIIDNGRFGTLIDVGAPEEMSLAIVNALEHPISKDILQNRGQEFSIQNVGPKYINALLGQDHGQSSC